MKYGDSSARSTKNDRIVISRLAWARSSASVIACSTKVRTRWQSAVTVASGASHSTG